METWLLPVGAFLAEVRAGNWGTRLLSHAFEIAGWTIWAIQSRPRFAGSFRVTRSWAAWSPWSGWSTAGSAARSAAERRRARAAGSLPVRTGGGKIAAGGTISSRTITLRTITSRASAGRPCCIARAGGRALGPFSRRATAGTAGESACAGAAGLLPGGAVAGAGLRAGWWPA